MAESIVRVFGLFGYAVNRESGVSGNKLPRLETFVENSLVRRPAWIFAAKSKSFDDKAVDWLRSIKRCNDDFAAPALWSAVQDSRIAAHLPEDARHYLELLFTENARRNRQIKAQCLQLGQILSGIGAEAVLLKGATWLFEEGSAAEDRMMRDIDCLVAPAAYEKVLAALKSAGYHPMPGIGVEQGHVHDAPLIHPEGAVSVEVHAEVTTRPALLSSEDVVAGSRPTATGLRLPSIEHRIVHNLIHAQIINGDYVGGAVGLRDSLDVARLVDSMDASAWPELIENARRRGYFRELSAAIHKAARFAGGSMPALIATDRQGARHALRCHLQRQSRPLDYVLRKWGILNRALAWERDAYPLGLNGDTGFSAHLQVNRRRAGRILQSLRRNIGR